MKPDCSPLPRKGAFFVAPAEVTPGSARTVSITVAIVARDTVATDAETC